MARGGNSDLEGGCKSDARVSRTLKKWNNGCVCGHGLTHKGIGVVRK